MAQSSQFRFSATARFNGSLIRSRCAAAMAFVMLMAGLSGCQSVNLREPFRGQLADKETPSRRHQPRTLESLIDESEPLMPPVSTITADAQSASSSSIGVDQVALEPPQTAIDARVMPPEAIGRSEDQLPEFMEAAVHPFGTVTPPALADRRSTARGETAVPSTGGRDSERRGINDVAGAPIEYSMDNGISKPVSPSPPRPTDPVATTASPPTDVAVPDQGLVTDSAGQRAVVPPVAAHPPAQTIARPPERPGVAEVLSEAAPIPGRQRAAPSFTMSASTKTDDAVVVSESMTQLLGDNKPTTPTGRDRPGRAGAIRDTSTATSPVQPASYEPSPSRQGSRGDTKQGNPERRFPSSDFQLGEHETVESIDRKVEGAAFAFSADLPANEAPPASTGNATPTPSVVNQPRQISWEEQLSSSIDLLSKQLDGAGSTKADLGDVRLCLLQLVRGDTVDLEDQLARLPTEDRAFWQHQLAAIEVMLNTKSPGVASPEGEPFASQRAAEAARYLNDAANALAESASLTVTACSFCTEVRGFGQITPVAGLFAPGQKVLIYCEVDNYAARQETDRATGEATQMARLQGKLEIQDGRGTIVHRHPYPSIQDKSRSRRNDFYMYFPVTVPDLPPGTYRMRLVVDDLVSGKSTVSEPELVFELRTAPAMSSPQAKTAAARGQRR